MEGSSQLHLDMPIFLVHRLRNGSPYAIRPLSVCLSLCLSACPVLSVLSVTFVHCGQTVGRIKMKLSMQVGVGPGHIVLDGDPALPSQERGQSPPPQFSALFYCGETATCKNIIIGVTSVMFVMRFVAVAT